MDYSSNTGAGQTEYQRALQVYNGKKALGDTAGADAAKRWSDQVNTAIGGIGNNNQLKSNNYMGQYEAAAMKQPTHMTAPKPFAYDAQTDPSYQAALRQAQAGAQTAQNNAMVGLGARGIGNSSIAVDRANQIQQKAIGNVNDTILPQLMAQAYNRYNNENEMNFKIDQENYGRDNDYSKNLAGLAKGYNDLGQQEIDNGRTAEMDAAKKRQEHIALANQLSEMYGVHVDPKDDPYYAYKQVEGLTPLAGKEYADRRADTKFQQDYQTRSLDNTIANTQADNARQDQGGGGSSASSSNAKDIESQVYEQAKEFQSEQDVNDYFTENGAYLAKYLGAAGVQKLKDSFLASFKKPADNTDTDAYKKAFEAASRDLDWIGLSPAEKQQRIKDYQALATPK